MNYFGVTTPGLCAIIFLTFTWNSSTLGASLEISTKEKDDCFDPNCSPGSDKSILICLKQNCKEQKKWVDMSHYSQRRRSVPDNLKSCIHQTCLGLSGISFNQCSRRCGRAQKRTNVVAGNDLNNDRERRWVDPLNYGKLLDDYQPLTAEGLAGGSGSHWLGSQLQGKRNSPGVEKKWLDRLTYGTSDKRAQYDALQTCIRNHCSSGRNSELLYCVNAKCLQEVGQRVGKRSENRCAIYCEKDGYACMYWCGVGTIWLK